MGGDSPKTKLSVPLAPVILVALAFSYLFQTLYLPVPLLIKYGALVALGAGSYFLYRDERFECELDKSDYVVAGSLFSVLFLSHLSGLFQPLGGDALYHSERAAGFLHEVKRYIDSFVPYSIGKYRESLPWGLFSIRHMAAFDIWRVIGLATLLIGILVTLFYRYLKESRRTTFLWSLFALFCCLSLIFVTAKEPHPPLRLLPWMVSALLFGLNEFAFRLPALLSVFLATFAIYKVLRNRLNVSERTSLLGLALAALVTAYLPAVFYVSSLVEPTAYGYLVNISVLLLCAEYLRTEERKLLIYAGVTLGIGVLLRQATIYSWAIVGLSYLLTIRKQTLIDTIKIFGAGLISLPYLIAVKIGGHTTIRDEGPLFEKLLRSLTEGVAPMSILNTTTIPWATFLLCGLVFVLFRATTKERLLFFGFIPAYVMFYMIWSYLWGLGRYQAEYIGPFSSYTVFLTAIYLPRNKVRIAILASLFLIVTTLEVNRFRSTDTNFYSWPRMRVTSQANFPYLEAFQYLKRADSRGNFIVIGGSPLYGPMSLWLAGFSIHESNRWEGHRFALNLFHAQSNSAKELFERMKKNKIKYVVTQSGTRREEQHRTGQQKAVLNQFETDSKDVRKHFIKERDFISDHGGVLTIYRLRHTKV